jgi:hypothetical protein
LIHFGSTLGVDEVEVELYTSSDLRAYHLVGNEEERRFMGGVYHRICMPGAELMLSNKSIDHLTKDLEVSAMRSLMLARATHRRHDHIKTDLRECITELEKSKKEAVR